MSNGYVCGVPPRWCAWLYYLGFLLVTIISWVLRDYGGSALDVGAAKGCGSLCGDYAVLRLSFGSMIFFAFMFLITLGVPAGEDSPRMVLHTGLWPIKFLLWAGIIGSTFAMNNGVFDVYQQIARVFSAFFILLQLIILLEFIYSINEYLLERDNCAFVLITVTGMLIAGSLVGMGFLYKFWAPSSTCSLNIFFITWTLVLFLVYGFLSISPWRVESAGLMTSAAVFAYCMYYTWSALNSEPIGACAPEGGGGSGAVKIIAFIIALLSVGFVTMNSGQSSAAFSLRGRRTNESNDDAISEDAVNYRPDFFHLIFLLASSYMGMVLTGWGIGYDQEQFGLDKGWGSVWAKIVASWVCALLYGWSLIAHKVLPEREF